MDASNSMSKSRLPELPEIWRPHEITREEALMYHLGPLDVVVTRRPKEFRFYYKYSAVQIDTDEPYFKRIQADAWRTERDEKGDGDPYDRYRITGNADPGKCAIKLYGRLADLPVVARPRSQIQITSGSEIDIFVTTPMWVEFEEIWANGIIHALPTWLPRRTWLGPPTGPGPLCYSTLIHARLNYEDIHTKAMRVITHIVIKNDGPRISLDRIVIPAPILQVYLNDREDLWTETVTIQRSSNGDFSKVKIGTHPPEIAGRCRLLSGRREKLPDPLSFQRIVHSLFHHSSNIQLDYGNR